MSSVIETIQNRRSCRVFKKQPVEESKIELLTKAALWAPTSKNNRPWEFVWVDSRELLDQLAACKPHGAELIKNAPLALVIFAHPDKSDVWVEDCSVAATMVQLAAEDLGLGSCWVQVHKRDKSETQSASDYCKLVLNAPSTLETAYIIAIGYKERERNGYNNEQLLIERVQKNGF